MKISEHYFAGFINDTFTAKAQALIDRLTSKYGEPLCGRNRAVFISKFCVIKVPINDNGLVDNDWEASVKSDITASGRWLELNGLVCCMQQKLNTEIPKRGLPAWVSSVDCQQVGYDRRGNLRAYDFGLH